MKTLITAVGMSLLVGVAALPAQEKGDAKPQKQDKQDEKARKAQEKITANDPAVSAIDGFIKKQSVDQKKDGWRMSLKAPPQAEFVADNDYFWHVETSSGPIKIRYFADTAPMHVSSGIYLARLGYYDGLNFHRIIPNFMAQGGCPMGRGTGGPGYFMDGEFEGGRKHDRPGLLSMANTGRPKSDGSQFFLTFVPTPWLDGKHTIWGEVVEGMDTIKALEKLGSPSGQVKGTAKIVSTSISVVPKKKPEGKEGKDKDGEHGDGKGEHGGEKGKTGGEHGGK